MPIYCIRHCKKEKKKEKKKKSTVKGFPHELAHTYYFTLEWENVLYCAIEVRHRFHTSACA